MSNTSALYKLKLKVCGMRVPDNIRQVAALHPDYMGFIFYPSSARFVADLAPEALQQLPSSIKKTGVFVNADRKEIEDRISAFGLNAIQLHGNESPEVCQHFLDEGVEVVKAFGIDEKFDFGVLKTYEKAVDYFLFDTKTAGHGGSGKVFNWKLLEMNPCDKYYFLSGGINAPSIGGIEQLDDGRLYALDLNSRFETEPGLKDTGKLKIFFDHLKGSGPKAGTEEV